MSQEYIYVPLQNAYAEIRLLRIVSKAADGRLSCSMTSWNRSEAPAFKAISYEWGSDSDDQIVIVNDGKKLVRRNCHYVLRQFYLHFAEDYVWIDSICINQEDDKEKSAQVGAMGLLYTQADRVVASVGDHDNDSDWLFDHLLGRCGGLAPFHRLDRTFAERMSHAIKAFRSRSYFTRLWIVPELANAKRITILCGEDAIGWTRLIWILDEESEWADDTNVLLQVAAPEASSHFTNLRWYRWRTQDSEISNLPHRGLTVENVLDRFGQFECADPRDRLYAFVGHLTGVRSDYSMSRLSLAHLLLNKYELRDTALWPKDLGKLVGALGLDMFDESIRALIMERRSGKVPQSPSRGFITLNSRPWFVTISVHESKDSFTFGREQDMSAFPSDALAFAIAANSYKKLIVGSKIVGLLPNGAQDGDCLYPHILDNLGSRSGHPWPSVALVFRKPPIEEGSRYFGGDYVVVGQAVLADCRWKDLVKEDSGFEGAACTMGLSVDDAIVLVAQDFVHKNGCDLDARLLRPLTKVSHSEVKMNVFYP